MTHVCVFKGTREQKKNKFLHLLYRMATVTVQNLVENCLITYKNILF